MSAAFEQGRFDEVERLSRDHLDRAPSDEMALSLLGVSLLRLQRPGDAAQAFRNATRYYPAVALHWNNLGTALRESGQLRDAEAAYSDALRLEPRNADYLANMGFLHVQWGNVVNARRYLLEAFELDPLQLEARIYGAQMCLDCGEDDQARKMLYGWREWVGELMPQLVVELGSLLIRSGNSADGEMLLRRHENDRMCGTAARARLVVVLERLNRLDEARAILQQLPAPDTVEDGVLRWEILEAHAVMAERDKNLPEARSLIEERLGKADVGRWRTSGLYMLAKICDKQRDYAAAMEYLRQAHACHAENLKQLVPDLFAPGATPLRIAEFHVTAEQFATWQPDTAPTSEESPVFVVGFPRSGTTMLEQMLDAHPDLQSMDERAFLQDVVAEMGKFGLRYPEQLGELDSTRLNRLRDVYWNAVSKVVTLQSRQQLVDKNPLNMLRLPLIVRLFPDASIIFVVRHPCDVLLSCYMQQFRAPGFAALCTTLESLAHGYVKAIRFWTHHVNLLQPRCIDWRYEDVIANFDANVERLGAFLGVRDVTPLRSFSEHARKKGFIATPSYSQVVKPLYADSIGHWRKYRLDFELIVPVLEPVLRQWGYEV